MARIDWVEARLLEWAEWIRSHGQSDYGTGFPVRNCLDPDWGAPSTGQRIGFKIVMRGKGAATHQALRDLSITVQQTIVLHYVENMPTIQVARRLKCACSTVDQRIWKAHSELARVLRNMANG